MSRVRRLVAGALVATVTGSVGIACGSPEPPPAATAGDGMFPVTITHLLGETEIPQHPRRIVALSHEWDLLGRLDIDVVGHNDNAYAPGEPYPWQVGVFDPAQSTPVVDASQQVNLEAVAALDPDLILATNLSTLAEFYPRLSEIAPTVGYTAGWNADSWQDNATTIGRAVGEPERTRAVITEVEDYLADYADSLPGLRGRTFVNAYLYEPGAFAVTTGATTPTALILGRLGLRLDPDVTTGDANGVIARERIGLLDADLLLLSYGSDALRAELVTDPLFTRLPVVRENRYTETDEFGAVAANYPTVLNIAWSLDAQREVLTRVAGGS